MLHGKLFSVRTSCSLLDWNLYNSYLHPNYPPIFYNLRDLAHIMTTIPASYVPPPSFTPRSVEHYPPKEVTPLANASASGDLDTIKRILGSYLADRSPEKYALQEFWPVLLTALAYDYPEIVSYLLDVGIPLALVHVQQAIETKSAAVFDVLLRHGWNINEPLSETQPSALA